MRICLIVNPVAGQSRAAAALPPVREWLEAGGASVTVRETRVRGDGERLARELRPGEFDRSAVVGGDGTLNEVLNGLGDHAPLGLLPLGTVNVLARELGVPLTDLRAACDVLLQGTPRPLDLGCCNGRRFSLMAGMGFDAEAVREVPPNVKDLVGAPAYVLSGLRALAQIDRAIRYRLYMPERRIASRGMMLVVANAASYAGDLKIAPLASLEDGWLDLCLFRERSRLAFLGQWVRVLFRRQLQDPHFLYHRTREVRVVCTPPASVQLDGDYYGRTPVTIRVLPGAVQVVRP